MDAPKLRLAVDDTGAPEIFHSIQGEGVSQGSPRVFIRLSGCNLHCKWCDTAYTWNWTGTDFVHDQGRKFDLKEETSAHTAEEIAETVHQFSPIGIVITGGEPLLQLSRLPDMIDAIKAKTGPVWVEIETNGTIEPSDALILRINQFNVSPKLIHSGNDRTLALKDKPLIKLARLSSSWFKFVMSAPEDIREVTDFAQRYKVSAERILLMPQGVTEQELRAHTPWVTELCLKHGYRFSDRLHIHLYGDTRGT